MCGTRSVAPWVRKFGYLCIYEIVVLTKFVYMYESMYICPFMSADVKCCSYSSLKVQGIYKLHLSWFWTSCYDQLTAVIIGYLLTSATYCIGGSGVQLIKLKFSADQLWYSVDRRQRKLYFGKDISLKFPREICAKSIYFNTSINDRNRSLDSHPSFLPFIDLLSYASAICFINNLFVFRAVSQWNWSKRLFVLHCRRLL